MCIVQSGMIHYLSISRAFLPITIDSVQGLNLVFVLFVIIFVVFLLVAFLVLACLFCASVSAKPTSRVPEPTIIVVIRGLELIILVFVVVLAFPRLEIGLLGGFGLKLSQ